MLVDFTKMNGAGNDFVMIDNRKLGLQLSTEQIQTLCHRQRGVGADGVLLLREAKGDADLGWDFFNQDGSCLLYTSPSPRDQRGSRMPSSA